MILVITFMAMIYQYYDVVIVNRVWWELIFFLSFVYSAVLPLLIENVILYLLNFLGIFVGKSINHMSLGQYLTLYYVPFIYMSSLELITHCLDYYATPKYILKSCNISLPTLYYFFKIVLATVDTLDFHINKKISLSLSEWDPEFSQGKFLINISV